MQAVVWHDGAAWRAALDTSDLHPEPGPGGAPRAGALAAAAPMTNFRAERQYGTFSAEDACNYALNIYDAGAVLSIVVDADPHGTHVAGIAAACHPDAPELNGAAPGAAAPCRACTGTCGLRAGCVRAVSRAGDSCLTCVPRAVIAAEMLPPFSFLVRLAGASVLWPVCCPDQYAGNAPSLARALGAGAQIISCKIGDSRLGSMETGTGLTRALIDVLAARADLVNMSYGEATSAPDQGRLIDLITEVRAWHRIRVPVNPKQ